MSSHRQALRVFILCNEYEKVSLAFGFFVLTSDLNSKSFITSRQCEEFQVSAQRKLESVQESEDVRPKVRSQCQSCGESGAYPCKSKHSDTVHTFIHT